MSLARSPLLQGRTAGGARCGAPPPFRDSFLHRNPVNAALLAAAAR